MVVGPDRHGDFQAAGRSTAETVSGGEPRYASGNAQNAGGRFAEVERPAAGRKTEIVTAQKPSALLSGIRAGLILGDTRFACATGARRMGRFHRTAVPPVAGGRPSRL